MPRSDLLPARLFRRARSAIRQTEAFLEDALAAALEHPDAWPRLRHLGGWTPLPELAPTHVLTQDPVEGGRTDIVLRWAEGSSLVLELKAWDPLPAEGKLAIYGQNGNHVSVIAPHPTIYPPPFLPMLTWARLRAVPWPLAPLPWRQLCHLIDETGVAVPRLEMPAIVGLVPTWDTYDLLEGWIRSAAEAVASELKAAGWPCTTKTGAQRQRVSDEHRRYGMLITPTGTSEEGFSVFCGVYMGHDRRMVLVPGVPDLRLMLNVNPKGAVAEKLRADPSFGPAARAWAAPAGDGIARQHDPDWWYLLDARQPLLALAAAEDQNLAFRGWMTSRAKEWAQAGIPSFLAQV